MTAKQASVPRSLFTTSVAGASAFLTETGWHPSHIGAVAGALIYSRYNFLIRLVTRRIARKAGAPVDTSRDYEFTNWTKLHKLIEGFVQSIPSHEEDLCRATGKS